MAKKTTGKKRPDPKRSVGRPTAYKREFAQQAEKLCRLGATDFELADFFKVNTATIYRWRAHHKEFCEALVDGKDYCDERVKRSLYQRAVGYTFESEKVMQHQGETIRVPIVEHVPPDPGAAMSWLKNRKGDDWREKQEIEVKHTFTDLSDEELAKELADMKARIGQ